MIIHEGQIKAN